MLNIKIKGQELFIPDKNEFVTIGDQVLKLEHSLVSISAWEEKWHEKFLNPNIQMTQEQVVDYIKCMTLNEDFPEEAYNFLSSEDVNQIKAYMEDPHTATTINSFGQNQKKYSNKVTTAEEIYYMMFSYGIPKECETWHINKLLTLIEVFSVKNGGEKKMSTREIMQQNAALNAARKAKLNTKG